MVSTDDANNELERSRQGLRPGIEVLACPHDLGQLAETGMGLSCTSGHTFPIIDGVPSFLTQERDVIRSSFSRQWSTFRAEDRTWNATAAERLRRFPEQVNLPASELSGSLILDAGCGNGALSNELTQLGCDVVAADISTSVRDAAERFHDNSSLFFVEADLMNPPFRSAVFDVVFSGGVLHHTANTREAFTALARTVAPGGSFYVWLYWPVSGKLLALKLRLRPMISRLPGGLRYGLVLALLPQSMLRHYFRALRHREPRMRWRERLVVMLDSLTPRFRWEHTPDEVEGWFRALGFVEITQTDHGTWGFGMVGKNAARTGEPV
jgi:SAM-dependent methyltransferase